MQFNLADKKLVPLLWKKQDGTNGTATDVTVTSSDDTVASGSIGDDPEIAGQKAVFLSLKGPGSAVFTVNGDTDPGDGVKNVSNVFTVDVLPEFADHLEFGEPKGQPPPA